MQVIMELCEEHRRLERRASALVQMVGAASSDPVAAAALRWRLAQALFEHCAREDRAIYDRLMASGDAPAIAASWHYRCEHGTMVRDFAGYIAEWPVGRIGREWPQFRADTETMMDRLARRIEREEAVLYPHAERVMMRRAA
jgi:hemerythrin-like domain-containing protein